MTIPYHDKPLAAKGLVSYRARSPYGYIMIGARSHGEAWREALRSSDKPSDLQIWNVDSGSYKDIQL